MSNKNQNELSQGAKQKQNVLREKENKKEIEDSNRADKQETLKPRNELHCKKLEDKRKQKSVNDPDKTVLKQTKLTKSLDKVTISIDNQAEWSSVEGIKVCQDNQVSLSKGHKDKIDFVSVQETSVDHGDGYLYDSKPSGCKTTSSQGMMDAEKSSPAVNTVQSLDATEVPYQTLETNKRIPLSAIGPSSTTASDDASDAHLPNELTEPAQESAPIRYDNNSSYAAAIRGGLCTSMSESWKGALETSCSSSLEGSHESLKHDNSHEDHTLCSNMSATTTPSKLLNTNDRSSPMSVGNNVIPIITTSGPGNEPPEASPSAFLVKRKLSQESRLARQQSQPSPKEKRCIYRGFRRSISSRVTSSEGEMLQHGWSGAGIGNEDRCGYCLNKHHCYSLHSCDTSPSNLHSKNGKQRDEGGIFYEYLQIQNDHCQCHHHGHPINRICRHGACTDTTTHIIGSGMCMHQPPDSIATIAVDSLKLKGATKMFNQVKICFSISCCKLPIVKHPEDD